MTASVLLTEAIWGSRDAVWGQQSQVTGAQSWPGFSHQVTDSCFPFAPVMILQFPNAAVLNAVGRRNTQMTAKERKCPQKSANASPQMSANECKCPQKSANASPQKSAKERKRAQKSAKERFCVKTANNQV